MSATPYYKIRIFVFISKNHDPLLIKSSLLLVYDKITIRHLLTHTSGLGYGFIDNNKFRTIYQKAGIIDAFTTEPVSIEDNIKKLAKHPLHDIPGEKYRYIEGLDVLGYFIKVWKFRLRLTYL